jgi:hypothetical protein
VRLAKPQVRQDVPGSIRAHHLMHTQAGGRSKSAALARARANYRHRQGK